MEDINTEHTEEYKKNSCSSCVINNKPLAFSSNDNKEEDFKTKKKYSRKYKKNIYVYITIILFVILILFAIL